MTRAVSAAFKTAFYSQETGETPVGLLTITHDTGTIRLSNDSVNTTSGGNVFDTYPFKLTLPTNEEGKISEARITVDNVGRKLIDEIRTQTNALQIQIDIVLASAPNTIVATFPDFSMRDVQYGALQISGRLTLEDMLAEPFPKDIMSAATFPGQFFAQ